MKKASLFLVFFSLMTFCSCVSVRQADLDAWRGVPVIDLESHPVFNAMTLEKKTLSDGSTMWSYTKRGGSFQNCNTNTQKRGDKVTSQSTSSAPVSYDRYGYDRYGYDRYGYNRDGYNRQGVKRSTAVNTTSTNESSSENTNCRTGEYVCVNQFLVSKEGIVLWYHPTGNYCYTDCTYRPASRRCR